MKKVCCLFMIICCAFSFNTYAYAKGYVNTSKEYVVDIGELSSFLEDYMYARELLLTTGEASDLEAVACAGIISDEIAHRNYIVDDDLEIVHLSSIVMNVETWDSFLVVEVNEEQMCVARNISPYLIEHTITILASDDKLTVISDQYYEESTGFKSCSFVDLDLLSDISTNSTVSYGGCFLQIANREVGYLEKASNYELEDPTANPGTADYTKYGQWYGYNPAPWCAIFVSWCANQAGISRNVIPKEKYVPYLADFYKEQNRYYTSIGAGGNYTPMPGDILFYYDNNHTGIVYEVKNGIMTIIDGNWTARVCKRQLSISDTAIIGFGSPNYTSSGHRWVYTSTYYRCSTCGVTATSIPSISSV